MKTTVNFSNFCDAFHKAGRDNNFSYDGKRALFDYLEEMEQSTGEELELDVIALCCDFAENHTDDIVTGHDIDTTDMDDDEKREALREYLQTNTFLVGETPTGFIYAAF